MSEKKVIFTTNFHPFTTRNLFDTGVMDRIASGAKTLVVFVPPDKEALIKERYENGNCVILPISLVEATESKRNTLFRRLAKVFLHTRTQYFHQLIYLEKTKNRKNYYIARAITYVSAFFWPLRPLLRVCDRWCNPSSGVFDAYIEKYKPDLFLATDMFDPNNVEFLKAAEKHHIPTMGFVRSWDNTSTKHYLRVVPDLIIAHNELERVELGRFHNVSPGRVRLSGVPHFEKYLSYKPISREAFCAEMGIDPKKRIIVFSPGGPMFIDTDWQFCEILKQLYEEKKIPQDVHIIIRPHPQLTPDLSRFTPNEHMTIDLPKTVRLRDGLVGIELAPGVVDHLADTLYHMDLLVNVISTIIVEASIFNKPVITLAFNGWEKNVPFIRSVERIQLEEWPATVYPDVTPFVKSKEELALWINRFLEHPDILQEKRKQFVENHCYKFDGKSGERIADIVLHGIHSDSLTM